MQKSNNQILDLLKFVLSSKSIYQSIKLNIMRKMQIFLATTFLLIFFSCRKDSAEFFDGTVDSSITCSGSTGFVFIIKYQNMNREDSFSTLTLPSQFKLVGTKINFQLRDLNQSDETMFCNAMIIPPKQKIIYNVKSK